MKKIPIEFICSFLFALLCEIGMFKLRDFLEWLDKSFGNTISILPNYDTWLWITTLVVLPLGSVFGLVLIEKVYFKSQINYRGLLIGVFGCFFAFVVLLKVLPFLDLDILSFFAKLFGEVIFMFFFPLYSSLILLIVYAIAQMLPKETL